MIVVAAGGNRHTACPHMPMLDMSWLDALQWPAMAVTVLAAWLVASRSKRRRRAGFWVFLLSNALWIVWGWHDHAYALIVLQIALALMNVRGAFRNDPQLSSILDS